MKSTFFSALSILTVFLITPSFAEPLSALEPRAKPTAADTAIAYIENSANSANINPSCFFSGQTIVQTVIKGKKYSSKKTAESALNDFKSARKCHVIAEIVGKAGVSTSTLSALDWQHVSKALAETVKGPVYVLLGKDVRSNSVWLTDEKPALKANKGVTTVEVWEIETDGSVKKTSKTKATL
ncbi:hypothetical protein CPB84DRAFT_1852715 [Gymnopilus junonius]|uniref:Uncharacterized protein n=1 Tax=Gymnopilus junonius TaxID=109634 RepID=A0A9P5NBC1_GYMJU|nr:hypothetical protein CPB84DRAFT_1852715 [Gymnopilus junonius]